MIKHINHQNFSTTPFVAAKSWDLYNVYNENDILTEQSGSSSYDYNIALDYVDYNMGDPIINRLCNISIEQQDSDILYYEEGITGSGMFDPDNDPKNLDGTYKRLVHDQIKNAFYNRRNNPSQIFGVEYIDFPLSQTKRFLSDEFRMFTIPRIVFGEKVSPNSVYFYDNNLDDNVIVHDDGYQNLNAGFDLFSKIQEIRYLGNIVLDGVVYNACTAAPTSSGPVPTSGSDSGSSECTFYFGTVETRYMHDSISTSSVTFTTGGIAIMALIQSGNDIVTSSVSFFSGSLESIVHVVSALDASVMTASFLSGSLSTMALAVSASDASVMTASFFNGSVFVEAVPANPCTGSSTLTTTFLNGGLV